MIESTVAPSLNDVEQLRNRLLEDLQSFAHPKILGAQLGTKLNSAMAPSNFKAWLRDGNQNLRAFAEQFLEGIVTPTDERQGLDFLFRVEGRTSASESFDGELWKAFCTLRPARSIQFDKMASCLRLSGLSDQAKPNEILIPQVNAEEHKAMCLAFAEELGAFSLTAARLRAVADKYEPSDYAVWVATLKLESGLFKKWGAFRVAHIKRLFSGRLLDLTMDEPTRVSLEKQFQADYDRQRSTKPRLSAPTSLAGAQVAPAMKSGDQPNRETLLTAIETLTDVELARILVPLDLVATLLTRTKH